MSGCVCSGYEAGKWDVLALSGNFEALIFGSGFFNLFTAWIFGLIPNSTQSLVFHFLVIGGEIRKSESIYVKKLQEAFYILNPLCTDNLHVYLFTFKCSQELKSSLDPCSDIFAGIIP